MGISAPLEHLKYDVTALAHYLRSQTSVLVIGVGGGRDILTALVFGQRHVTGVEINPDILDVLTRPDLPIMPASAEQSCRHAGS